MNAKCVMLPGTNSGDGKHWRAIAVCRHYARQGLTVAPSRRRT